MFDIGAAELLVVVIVAVLVIGPKDMPLAMRTAGRWIGKVRQVSAHFRSGIDAMIRESELEELEKKWKAQNEAIMAKTGGSADNAEEAEMTGPPAVAAEDAAHEFPKDDDPVFESPSEKPLPKPKPPKTAPKDEPQLPLGGPEKKG